MPKAQKLTQPGQQRVPPEPEPRTPQPPILPTPPAEAPASPPFVLQKRGAARAPMPAPEAIAKPDPNAAAKLAAVRQASFISGELSDKCLSRTDLPQYASGVRSMENWILQPQGSVTRRPGTKYLKTCKAVTFPNATERASATGAFDLNAVCYAAEIGINGRWVAVGDANGTEPVIVYSDDHGATWAAAPTVPNENYNLYCIAWSGSMFVALGATDGTDATAFSSPDGLTWTTRVSGTAVHDLNSVLWTGTRFVAVGAAGDARYSANGVTWSASTGLDGTVDFYGLSIVGTLLVCVYSNAGRTKVGGWYSDNGGLSWVVWEGSVVADMVRFTSIYWNGYIYTAGAVAGQGRIVRAASIPLTSLTVHDTSVATTTYHSLMAIGPYLCAVGDSGVFSYTLNGTNWTDTTIETVALRGIAVSGRNAVIVGDNDGGAPDDAQLFTQPLDVTNRRLIPFVGSTEPPYMMEFGHLYIRYLRDELYVESTPGTPYETTSPWDANDIAELQFAQANDVMYITHPYYAPRKLSRTSESTFTLTNLMDPTTPTTNPVSSTFKLWDGPYMDPNRTVVTMTISAVGTGSVTVTASAATAFALTDVGRTIRLRPGALWGWGIITAVAADLLSATVYIVEDPNSTSATAIWALGAFSATTGYPTAVTFHQQRLWYGGTRAQPMTKWSSLTASFEEFDPTERDDTVVDDNSVILTMAARRMSAIRWLSGTLALAVGTRGGVYFVTGGQDGTITPSANRGRLTSEFDVDAVLPAMVGDIICYVQQGGRHVRGLSPGVTADTYAQPDLTILAEQITRTGLLELAFAPVPNSIVWGRRTDGVLTGLTLNSATQTVAWHEHPLAGSLSGSDQPAVISLAVLPIYGHDQLYLCTRRTVNGVQVEFVEALQLPFDSLTDDPLDACYLDAAVKYDGVSTTAITGLSHLEGQSVRAYADGIDQGAFTVASGGITLTTAAAKVWAGLSYDAASDLETMPVRPPGTALSSAPHGNKVRVISTVVELLDTIGLKVGASFSDLLDITSGTGDVSIAPSTWVAGQVIAPVTGVREVPVGDAADYQTSVCFRPAGAYPATITGLVHFIEYDHI